MLLWENKDLILAYYIGGEPENFEWTLGNLGSTGLIWSLLSLVQGFPSHAPAHSGTAFLVPYGKRSPEIETLDSQKYSNQNRSLSIQNNTCKCARPSNAKNLLTIIRVCKCALLREYSYTLYVEKNNVWILCVMCIYVYGLAMVNLYLLANMSVRCNRRKKISNISLQLMHGCNNHNSLICIGATSGTVCGYRSNHKRAGSLKETRMTVLGIYLFFW
jgi:hypothetical protein